MSVSAFCVPIAPPHLPMSSLAAAWMRRRFVVQSTIIRLKRCADFNLDDVLLRRPLPELVEGNVVRVIFAHACRMPRL